MTPRPQLRTPDAAGSTTSAVTVAAPAPASAPPPAECELPNGRLIHCLSPAEAMVLWNEATGDGLYRAASEELQPGDTVLDVGANIGVTSLMFGWRVPGLRIIALEPAPRTYGCLEANLQRYLPDAVAVPAAVCESAGERKFTFYPRASGNSGLFADREADDRLTEAFLRNSGIPEEYIGEMVRGLHRGEELTVPAVTVSDLIRRHGLAEISLLKVDVERAEHLVLAGVEEQHWPLVRRVVAEVHDEHGRLAEISALLQRHGFRTVAKQQPVLAGTGLYELDAHR